MLKPIAWSLFMTLTVITTRFVNAQRGAEATVETPVIQELVALLDHEDPATANAALDSLANFCKSRNNKIRFHAQIALKKFNEEAWAWLKENARFGHPISKETAMVRGRASYLPTAKSWDERHEGRYSIDFVDADIDPAKLIYLRVVGVEGLAFVNMPQLKDKHLAYLVDQPNLISLTLENTNVRGSGFQRANIPSMQTVFLTGSPVNDKGLLALNKKQFPVLQQIVVVDTRVSAGAEKAYLEKNPIILRRDR